MAYDFDLFVIGGGSGGTRCGRIAAGLGARVAVAEERFWGGTCVNIGCVPKKLMVMASEYGAAVEDAAGFGWSIEPGAHDWASLIAAKDREVGRLAPIYRRLLEGAGATVFDARAQLVDAHTLEVGGRRVSAERIVIATGGRPLRPEFPGAALTVVSDDVFALESLPERIVVLGSGYIALEFAGIFAGLGRHVDLVYRQPLPLRGFDGDIREAMAEALKAQGIHQHPFNVVERVEDAGGARRVLLSDGSTIEAELVFAAMGRGAYTQGLGLEAAGVGLRENGSIPVDEQNATNVANIYAIGDVTDRLNLTPVAIAEGHALAERLFGAGRSWHLNAVATAVFTTPPVATVGLTEEDAATREAVDIYLSRFTPMRHTLSGRPRKTLMKLVVSQATHKVLGAHMLGEDAPEIIQGLSVALNAGATKQDFDMTVGIHPTAAEEFVTMRTRAREARPPEAGAAP
ncbi:MAG: glutathione-disulfide reductase [Rhodospirillales bacterium]|nr:glutathione-disulfide reductase [Rhodospirillales bacterium]